MTMNPLPPQAYTKDTLMKAYAWLMNQSESIREMATTPDILISLYLKTHRDDEAVLERPSIQNFKNELKSLAGLMGELEPQGASAFQQNSMVHHSNTTHQSRTLNQSVANHYQQAPPVINVNVSQPPLATPVAPTAVAPTPKPSTALDEKSLAMIQEVRNDFNLSDDQEALRMLIKIGYSRAKNMIS